MSKISFSISLRVIHTTLPSHLVTKVPCICCRSTCSPTVYMFSVLVYPPPPISLQTPWIEGLIFTPEPTHGIWLNKHLFMQQTAELCSQLIPHPKWPALCPSPLGDFQVTAGLIIQWRNVFVGGNALLSGHMLFSSPSVLIYQMEIRTFALHTSP